jgi:hypothetical protein
MAANRPCISGGGEQDVHGAVVLGELRAHRRGPARGARLVLAGAVPGPGVWSSGPRRREGLCARRRRSPPEAWFFDPAWSGIEGHGCPARDGGLFGPRRARPSLLSRAPSSAQEDEQPSTWSSPVGARTSSAAARALGRRGARQRAIPRRPGGQAGGRGSLTSASIFRNIRM